MTGSLRKTTSKSSATVLRLMPTAMRSSAYRHGSKKPCGQWGGGHGPAILQICDPLTANTGLLCAGLAVFDVDLPEPEDIALAQQIHSFLTAHLPPGFLERRRQNSERLALILRTRK